ncbi:hypothetical protein GWI33_018492 [Rhynchophorus ferrugineus]|uniref:Uncharacterized protein n=1 Tax=Rhynchophorus ferrugineus TaxID=354439 RepID=A0A834HUS9_RHYFE|nr:hypothetical protein GWI33_018492 [Rhynchophorus ferrugineus]
MFLASHISSLVWISEKGFKETPHRLDSRPVDRPDGETHSRVLIAHYRQLKTIRQKSGYNSLKRHDPIITQRGEDLAAGSPLWFIEFASPYGSLVNPVSSVRATILTPCVVRTHKETRLPALRIPPASKPYSEPDLQAAGLQEVPNSRSKESSIQADTNMVPAPRRDPTTAQRGDFWLLGSPSGPVRPSLGNLVTPSSPRVPILTSCLVWTPGLHETPCVRTPDLKPSTETDLQAAGLQETPSSQSEDFVFLLKSL